MLKSVVGLEFRVVNGKYSREWDWLCTVTTVQGYLNPPILSFSLWGSQTPTLSLYSTASCVCPRHLHRFPIIFTPQPPLIIESITSTFPSTPHILTRLACGMPSGCRILSPVRYEFTKVNPPLRSWLVLVSNYECIAF